MTENIVSKVRKMMETGPYNTFGPHKRNTSLIKIVEEIINNNISGDFVECGVAEGLSCSTMAYTLIYLNKTDKFIWLYDTFEGTKEQRGGFDYPSEFDIDHNGNKAQKMWDNKILDKYATPLNAVKNKMFGTGYKNLKFIMGKVEDTIPENIPEKISILRLDTDFYYSTKHELEQLFPKLEKDGYLIIDDYGHWDGCKKAVNEYFEKNNIDTNKLKYVDYTCVIYKKE